MCGISGFIDPNTPPIERLAAVERMGEAMAHRGPDESGVEAFDDGAMGMRRLAIFDPANGHQPMRTSDGRYSLIFNGSILNHQDLRAELSGRWTFKTQCDTEALLAAFVHWGESCLGKLRGMFAFALWDNDKRTLFLARDPFGIKPLYYKHEGKRFLFASEVKGLLAAAPGAATIDPLAVADYLAWFAVPAPRTIFRGIFGLRPGECATFRNGQLDIRTFWNFRSIGGEPKPECGQGAEFTRNLRSRLENSVRAHMLADVPVGAFLSGGLDSAVVTGLMTRMGGTRLRTFTIGFSEPGYSESLEAEATAKYYGTDHYTRILSGSEVAADLDRFLNACDQPTGDGINTYYASQTAKAGGATVALSGLGGDELFGGYPTFRNTARIARWLPAWRSLPIRLRRLGITGLRRGDTRMRKFADTLAYARDENELCALQRRVFSEPRRRSLLGRETLSAIEGETPFHPELALLRSDLKGLSAMERVSAWELRTYMADVLLRDSDIMSMRHALELRVPFIDRPLIEWLWHQNRQDRFSLRTPKGALVAAVADLLPPGFQNRRKRGFTLPMDLWMRGPLKAFLDETFSDSSVSRSGFFDRAAVQASWRRHLGETDRRDWSRVWSLAMLVAFVNRQSPGPPRPKSTGVTLATPAGSRPRLGAAPSGQAMAEEKRDETSKDGSPRKSHQNHTLFLAPEVFSSVGGIPRMLQIYLKALCDLAAPDRRGVRMLALNDPELDSRDVRRYANDSLDDWCVCGRSKKQFIRAALRMSRGCDTLVCGHLHLLPVAWMAHRLNPRLRYYLVAHGIEVWRPFSMIEKVALRGAEKVLCISEYTRQELQKYCALKEGRAVVLPNALDPSFVIAPGKPLSECPPVILTVSRLTYEDRYKGIDHLISAMPAVRAAEPGATLRIVGYGDDLPRLQALARREGLFKNGVEFLGFVNDAQMAVEMRSCRLFALPSRKEGFGLVFLEAMAHGRPCLGASAGGIPEVISDETGVLVEFGDAESIAQACISALRRDWSQKAILDRARQFSYASFKDRLAALLAPTDA